MYAFIDRHRFTCTVIALAAVCGQGVARAQSDSDPSQPTTSTRSIGVQGLGLFGANWPAATQSLEATGLDRRPTELGAGLQVTDLWRDLFCQVTVTQTSSTGERVFLDSDGTVFPLGIPLSVKARYIDVGVGWKSAALGSRSVPVVPYVSGGVGRVRYRESSPFAESTDDVETSATSYHVQSGFEVRLVKWLAVSGDFRYRWVPDLLGAGGASAVFGESDFGGFNAGIGMRIVLGGTSRTSAAADPAEAIPPAQRDVPGVVERNANSNSAVIMDSAPVFLRMDATIEPLRILEAGTSVKVIAEEQDWVRIEFYDRLLGSRVGYVERKHIRIPKLEAEGLVPPRCADDAFGCR